MPILDDFGQEVTALLGAKGLNPYDVRRKSGGKISHQTVRNMAQGNVTTIDSILELADVLGETPEEDAEIANRLLARAGKRWRIVPPSELRGVYA